MENSDVGLCQIAQHLSGLSNKKGVALNQGAEALVLINSDHHNYAQSPVNAQ